MIIYALSVHYDWKMKRAWTLEQTRGNRDQYQCLLPISTLRFASSRGTNFACSVSYKAQKPYAITRGFVNFRLCVIDQRLLHTVIFTNHICLWPLRGENAYPQEGSMRKWRQSDVCDVAGLGLSIYIHVSFQPKRTGRSKHVLASAL